MKITKIICENKIICTFVPMSSPNSPSPRRSKSSIYERSRELDIEKENREIKAQQRKIRENDPKLYKLKKFYRKTPFPVPPDDPQWDDDGNLLNTKPRIRKRDILPEPTPSKDPLDEEVEVPKKIISSKKLHSFIERNTQRKKDDQLDEKNKIILPPPASFDSFMERQKQSEEKRFQKTPPHPPQTSYITPESRKILSRPSSRTSRRPVEAEEYSFRPDLSKSLQYPARGFSVVHAEAHIVMKDIERQTLEIEAQCQENNECTFHPDLSSTKDVREKLARQAEERHRREEQERIKNEKKAKRKAELEAIREAERKREEEKRKKREIDEMINSGMKFKIREEVKSPPKPKKKNNNNQVGKRY